MDRRSPDSDRGAKRKRSRSRERRHHRDADRRKKRRSRSREREGGGRDRDREVYRERERELEKERAQGKGARGNISRGGNGATREPEVKPAAPPPLGAGDDEDAKKRARLGKLAALLKAKEGAGPKQEAAAQEQQDAVAEAVKQEAAKQEAVKQEEEVWLPWEQQQPAVPAGFGDGEEGEEQHAAPAPTLQERMAAQRAKAAADLAQQALKAKHGVEEDDPLDAFMATEVNPEVERREAEAKARRDEERRKMAEQLQNGKAALPSLQKLLEESESDPDADPDREMTIPYHKVKLVVGPGGETIKHISRKSRCRLQIKREEGKLEEAFGSKSAVAEFAERARERAQAREGGSGRTTTLMFFGSTRECDTAQRMVEEALENREAKEKKREREYAKKREEKARNRQIYLLRHTRDYEALEVPVGASRADVKAAYKKMARLWHPDKHPENPEAAKERFQEIQRAFDSLMATDEDTRIEALAAK